MILSNSKDTIELIITGYEFPEISYRDSSEFNYDANGLNLYCKKNIDDKVIISTEP